MGHDSNAEKLKETRILSMAAKARALHGGNGDMATHRDQDFQYGQGTYRPRVPIRLGENHVNPQDPVRVQACRRQMRVQPFHRRPACSGHDTRGHVASQFGFPFAHKVMPVARNALLHFSPKGRMRLVMHESKRLIERTQSAGMA
eukprot:scaffold156046_cov29-Tisochrysis_lutea.AAC.3